MWVQAARENTNKMPDSLQETPTILHNGSTLHGQEHGKMKSDVELPSLQKNHFSTSLNQKMTATLIAHQTSPPKTAPTPDSPRIPTKQKNINKDNFLTNTKEKFTCVRKDIVKIKTFHKLMKIISQRILF
jgi:hypothetical protein